MNRIYTAIFFFLNLFVIFLNLFVLNMQKEKLNALLSYL
jgi:hypothetical protein